MNTPDAMTLEQWFAERNPDRLLALVCPSHGVLFDVLRPPPSIPQALARRLILFACACGRMVWDILPTNLCNAIEIRERFAEGRASEVDLRASEVPPIVGAVTVKQHVTDAATTHPAFASLGAAKALATHAAGQSPPGHPINRQWQAAWNRVYNSARATQAAILRDIFPPPGYTARLNPDCRTSTVLAIARQMDYFGDYSATPILADALQDAGCDDEMVLQSCRVPGNVHVRGNWVVDLVLGRA